MRMVMTFVNDSINFPGADGTKMVLGSSNSMPTLTNWLDYLLKVDKFLDDSYLLRQRENGKKIRRDLSC